MVSANLSFVYGVCILGWLWISDILLEFKTTIASVSMAISPALVKYLHWDIPNSISIETSPAAAAKATNLIKLNWKEEESG